LEVNLPFFDYSQQDLCQISVRTVSRWADRTQEEKETTYPDDDELDDPVHFKIHAGYRRALAGFTREIEFMFTDNIRNHNCVFRAVYLIMTLDKFAEELLANQARVRAAPSRFRSSVLNPLFQRQLRGVIDHETLYVKEVVGETMEDAAAFYLTLDPLDPALRFQLLRNLLYVWSVRLSLSLLKVKGTEDHYEESRARTERISSRRLGIPRDEWDETKLYDFEVEVIVKEGLVGYFRTNIVDSVSRKPLPQSLGSNTPILGIRAHATARCPG